MDFWEWEPYYTRILSDFGFDRRRDEEAAHLLSGLLPPGSLRPSELRRQLKDQVVTVMGNAPSLQEEMDQASGRLIAADEAVSVVLERGIVPDIIVTDLDGQVEDLLKASQHGALTLIHAHGDNIPALTRWVPRFPRGTIGTTQSRPFGRIYNFGGFTDGDRAAFLAAHFGAEEIRLIGFDFENPNPKDSPAELKRKKLAWARKLIGVLEESSLIRFPASSSSE